MLEPGIKGKLMRVGQKVLMLVVGVLISACEPYFVKDQSEKYAENLSIVDSFDIKRRSHLVFSRHSDFYIAQNSTENSQYAKQAVTNSLKKSLDYFFNSATVGSNGETLNESLKSTQRKGLNYLVYPTLEVWDENLDQWVSYSHEVIPQTHPVENQSGLLGAKSWKAGKTNAVSDSQTNDQIKLELVIIDVINGSQIDAIQIKTKVGFFSDSHDRPLEALDEPLMSLMEQLSGRRGQF